MTSKPPDNIIKLKEESLKRFIDRLSPSGPVSDAEFADVIYLATSNFGISEADFRDAFGLSSGAVTRWTTMKNLPQPTVRVKIFKWIEEKLKRKD